MRNLWISIVSAFLIQCTVLVLASPISVTTPSVEYLDSPSATEVVFDETGLDSMGNESIDENIGTTEVPDDSTASDDEPHTTITPCGNDIEAGLDCNPAVNSIDIQGDSNNVKTDEEFGISDKDEGTTESPKET